MRRSSVVKGASTDVKLALIVVVSLDLHGITRGKPLEGMGQRPLNQGEIFFRNVHVPRRFLIAQGPQADPTVREAIFTDANASRNAFEMASEALQMLGGNGLNHECPAEKLFRRARTSMIEDGENHVLSPMGAARR